MCINRVISCGVWAADRVSRILEVPGGTVGGRMPVACIPASNRAWLVANVVASSPKTREKMGL